MKYAPPLLAAAALLSLAGRAEAHNVFPFDMTLKPGGTDFVYVFDGTGCPADITVTSGNPLVTLTRINMGNGNPVGGASTSVTAPGRVDQLFQVNASPGITAAFSTTLDVCWIGSTSPNLPCPENNCSPPTPFQVMVTVEPFPTGTGSRPASAIASDPINTSSGELFMLEAPDLKLGGPLPLGFQRYFGGQLDLDGVGPGSLGPNWQHNFDWRLEDAGNAVEIYSPTGRLIRFENDPFFAFGIYELAVVEDVPFQLQKIGSDFVLADPSNGRMYTFNSGGSLTQVEDQNGNTLTIAYSSGEISTVTDGVGRTLTFGYNGSSQLTSVTDGTRTVAFTYDGNGQLATVTDALSNVTTYAYDGVATSSLVSKTYPEGNTRYTQAYAAGAKVSTQTDALGNTTSLAYDTNAGTTTITDPLLNAEVHTHTSTGELTKYMDAGGSSAPMQSDAQRRRDSVTDTKGRTSSWDWHASGRVSRITEPDGRRTDFGYTARAKNGFTFWDMTSLSRADGTSESFVYDANGNLTSHVDAAGESWSWTYDAMGNVLTTTNPAGAVSTLTWNADGTLASVLDDGGDLTTFGYDALLRVNLVTQPDMSTLAYTYDAMGRVATMTNELGGVTSFTYDRNGNLTSLEDPASESWDFAYDAMDRLETITDPLGSTFTTAFDELGRVEVVTDAVGDARTNGYDVRGNLVSTTDDLGDTWSRAFDTEGLRTSATNPLGNATTWQYDSMGRVSRRISPLGNDQRFTYDAMGRLATVRDPLGRTTQLAWDERSLLSSVTVHGGATCSYTRNELGRVTAVTDAAGNDWVSTYDDEARKTSQADPLGNQLTYQYDERDRLDHVDLPGAMGTLDLTYDAAGRLQAQTYSDGTTLTYGHDTTGRMTSASGVSVSYDAAGRMTDSNGLAVTRDAVGRVETLTLAPGKVVTYTYDARGRIETVSDWVGGATTFTYDAAGRVVSTVRPNLTETQLEYDDDDRLTRVHDLDPSGLVTVADHALTRNAAGRVTSAVRTLQVDGSPALGTAPLAYDAAGQVVGYTYDALGRVIDDGTRTYVWNLASQLVSYTETSSGNTVAFTHDAFGNLLSRTELGTTEDFVWNYALGLPSISVVRQGAADVTYYVHTPGGQLLHSVNANNNVRRFHHHDEQGTTTHMTNNAGTATDAWHHSPFGVELARRGSRPNRFTFIGRLGVMSEGNGLYHMRARVYDAASMRFLSRDPVEASDPRGINPYQYAFADPLTFVDPRGTTPEVVEGQVLIETKFQTIQDNFFDEIGIDFSGLGSDDTAAAAGDYFDDPQGEPNVGLLSPGQTGLVADIVLNLMQQERTSQILQAPRLLTTDSVAAGITVADPVSYVEDFDTELAQAATVSDAQIRTVQNGIVLTVRPQVTADRRFVTLDVRPQIATTLSTFYQPLPGRYGKLISKLRNRYMTRVRGLGGIVLPELSTRTATTSVSVPDSGTVMIGGLKRNVEQETGSGVPFLTNIPYVARLFRRNQESQAKRNLIVFVKARILEPIRE